MDMRDKDSILKGLKKRPPPRGLKSNGLECNVLKVCSFEEEWSGENGLNSTEQSNK